MTSSSTPEDQGSLSVLLSSRAVADYLGIPTGTLANWRYQGRGPAFVRIGRHVRYRAEDIARWIEGSVNYADDDKASDGPRLRLHVMPR